MRITIINGPNLNLLGKREKNIYGDQDFESFFTLQKAKYQQQDIELSYYQSNVEGELINCIHANGFNGGGIVLNAGAYTHTSIAIADAVAGIKTPVIEVHISNIFAREEYRHVSYLGKHCKGSLSGFGLKGYEMAIDYLVALNAAI